MYTTNKPETVEVIEICSKTFIKIKSAKTYPNGHPNFNFLTENRKIEKSRSGFEQKLPKNEKCTRCLLRLAGFFQQLKNHKTWRGHFREIKVF